MSTFLLQPRLNPEARNPPNGPTKLQRREMTTPWVTTKGKVLIGRRPPNSTNSCLANRSGGEQSCWTTRMADERPEKKSRGSEATETGHTSQGWEHSQWQSRVPTATVRMPPPTKPSTVFLGLNCGTKQIVDKIIKKCSTHWYYYLP